MDNFEVIILTARPAAGKSEIIDYLKKCSPEERARRLSHRGLRGSSMISPMSGTPSRVDDILNRHGRKRLWTDSDYYFTDEFVWNLFIEKITWPSPSAWPRTPNGPHRQYRHHRVCPRRRQGNRRGPLPSLRRHPERAGILYSRSPMRNRCVRTGGVSNPSWPTASSTTLCRTRKMEFLLQDQRLGETDQREPDPPPGEGTQAPLFRLSHEPEVTQIRRRSDRPWRRRWAPGGSAGTRPKRAILQAFCARRGRSPGDSESRKVTRRKSSIATAPGGNPQDGCRHQAR